jgi:hypothetical protein
MVMKDEKYIVFKRDDYEAYKWDQRYMLEEQAIPDAIVIRKQDVFAPPALEGYANAIVCVIDSLKHAQKEFGIIDADLAAEIASLQRIADYFKAQADDSYDFQRKLPD